LQAKRQAVSDGLALLRCGLEFAKILEQWVGVFAHEMAPGHGLFGRWNDATVAGIVSAKNPA